MVRGMEAISTLPCSYFTAKTTANGRRIAQTMRSLGLLPIKGILAPPTGTAGAGLIDLTRGWARPVPRNP